MLLALTVNLEHVTALLRAHGIAAYEQKDEVVVFAISHDRWEEVVRIAATDPILRGSPRDEQEVASRIAHHIADLVTGPHTHEVL